MKHCETCKFWSEMIAEARGDGVRAMCLSDGHKAGQFMPAKGTCVKHTTGMPVDLEYVPEGQRQKSIDYRKEKMDLDALLDVDLPHD